MSHEIADVLWRALGFLDVPADKPAYTREDVRALQIAASGIDALAGEDRDRALELIAREARTVSGFLGRIAEVEVDALSELQALRLREEAMATAAGDSLERSPSGWLIMYALRRRLDEDPW